MTHQQSGTSLSDSVISLLLESNADSGLSELFDRFSDGFLLVNDQFEIIYFNNAFARAFGVQKMDCVGSCIWSCFPLLQDSRYKQDLLRATSEHQTISLEVFSSEIQRWFKVDIYPSNSGLAIYLHDTTDQKRAADEIKTAKSRFSLAAKADALYDWEITSNQLHWGEGLLHHFGYQPDELQIAQWEQRLHPEDRAAIIAELNSLLADPNAATWKTEYRLRRKDGHFCNVNERGHIVRDETGAAVRMIGIMQNITDLKTSEEEVRKLSLIAKETVNAVFLTDTEHRIVWVNNAFTSMFGYSYDEALGKRASELLTCAEADPKTLADMHDRAISNESFRVEILNRTKDGHRLWCASNYQPVYGADGKVIQYFCIITDITQRKTLERELELQRRRTTAAVIQAQERERTQVGRELHDNINQVLTTVKLYQDLIQDGLGNSQELVARSSALLQQSINEIRILSKQLSAPTLGKIKLKDSVKELLCHIGSVNLFAIEADTAAIEELNISEELHLAIYRIIQEQLTNISKHAQASLVRISFELQRERLRMSITDDGKGFNVRQRRSGIGLTNMRMRAESLNGSFKIHSAPEQGCSLVVTFLLGKADEQQD